VLTLDVYPQWVHGRDTAGNYYHVMPQQTQPSPAALWGKMATKWHGATPELASVKVRATKASLPNKELKDLALRAWCELFGVEAPSEEDLKKSAVSTKAHKKERAEEGLRVLRAGKKGVEEWNENCVALSKMLHDVNGIDLAKAKLAGLKLQRVNWKHANLSGA